MPQCSRSVLLRQHGGAGHKGNQRELETLTHEMLHVAFPEMSEKEVDRAGKVISAVLWQENFRRVLLGKHTTPVRIS